MLDLAAYFQQRCGIVESFYADVNRGGYTPGQAADRIFEFYRGEPHHPDITLTVALSLLAKQEPAALARFTKEVGEVRQLSDRFEALEMDSVARGWMLEDIRFILGKAAD